MILPEHQPLRWFTPHTIFTSDGAGSWAISVIDGAVYPNPWEWVVTADSQKEFTCYYPGTIDLGGLERQGKTLNPLGYSVSRYSTPVVTNDTANSSVILSMTWVTSVKPIPPALVSGVSMAYTMESAEDYGELVGYQTQTFTTDSTQAVSMLKPADTQTMGALQATAVPTLHTQLMVNITWSANSTNGDSVLIPPAVVTIPQEIVKEDDLQYIYRLKRYADPVQVEN